MKKEETIVVRARARYMEWQATSWSRAVSTCQDSTVTSGDLRSKKDWLQDTRSARTSLEVRCNRRAAAGKRLEDRNLLKQMAFAGMLECCVKGDGPPARREVRTWRGSYWATWDQACAAGITGAEAGHGLPLTDWGAQNQCCVRLYSWNHHRQELFSSSAWPSSLWSCTPRSLHHSLVWRPMKESNC